MALKVSNKNRKVIESDHVHKLNEPVIDPSVDYTLLDLSTVVKWSKWALLGLVIAGLFIFI